VCSTDQWPSFRAYGFADAGDLVAGEIVHHDDIAVAQDWDRELLAAGAELRYLPAYSPDFNPIEQFFAKLKVLLRKAAARTIEALIAAIADALTKVSPQECENYLANQGYRRQL
jgi:transposase